jgi:hypothetical protein
MLSFAAKGRDILKKLKSLAFDRLRDVISGEKRRLILACSAGGVTLLLFTIVLLLAYRPAAKPKPAIPLRQTAIPPEEIFLPDEPDFLPGVMPAREQKTAWAVEDAASWWLDPLKNGEEQWRQKVEDEIDILLENIP